MVATTGYRYVKFVLLADIRSTRHVVPFWCWVYNNDRKFLAQMKNMHKNTVQMPAFAGRHTVVACDLSSNILPEVKRALIDAPPSRKSSVYDSSSLLSR